MSEVSGKVFFADSLSKKGKGRIIVNIYRPDSTIAGHTITEEDGSFSITGLTQGIYRAALDGVQLKKLRLTCSPAALPFNIVATKDGDLVDGLEFVIQQ